MEIYDSATKTWSAGPDLPNPRFGSVIVQYGLEEVSFKITEVIILLTFVYKKIGGGLIGRKAIGQKFGQKLKKGDRSKNVSKIEKRRAVKTSLNLT